MKKKLIIAGGVVLLLVAWGVFNTLDSNMGSPECLEITASDGDGVLYTYQDASGASRSFELTSGGKVIGLEPGEKIGLLLHEGGITGWSYEEQFYLLEPGQENRVYWFETTGAGTRRTGAGFETDALPTGCPQ